MPCSGHMTLDSFAVRSQINPVHSEQIHMVMPLSIHRTGPLRCTREWLAVTGRGWEAHSSSRDHLVIERRRVGLGAGTLDLRPRAAAIFTEEVIGRSGHLHQRSVARNGFAAAVSSEAAGVVLGRRCGKVVLDTGVTTMV